MGRGPPFDYTFLSLFFQIKVFCFHPTQGRKLDQRLVIHKEKTLSEATDVAYKVLYS